jgi:hypothetical protein
MTTNWNEIPSIDNLAMDWNYKPENLLGKRSTERLSRKLLMLILGEGSVPVRIKPIASVKIVSEKSHGKAYLFDLSEKGLAVVLDVAMKIDVLVRVGFFLGRNKIISRGIIRNVTVLAENYRTGIEFVQLENESAIFIKELKASSIYKT